MSDQIKETTEQTDPNKRTPLLDPSQASFELAVTVSVGSDGTTMTYEAQMNPSEGSLKVEWETFFKSAFVTPKPGTFRVKQTRDTFIVLDPLSYSNEELYRLGYVFGAFTKGTLNVLLDNAMCLPTHEEVNETARKLITQACVEILGQDPPQTIRPGFLDVKSEPSGKYFEPAHPMHAVVEAARATEQAQQTPFACCMTFGPALEGTMALLPAKDGRVTLLVEAVPSHMSFAKFLNDIFVRALKGSIAKQERKEVLACRNMTCESILAARRCVEQMTRSFELPPFVANHND